MVRQSIGGTGYTIIYLELICLILFTPLLLLLIQINVNSVTWHARLGHIGRDRVTRLAREGLFGSLTKIDLFVCESCLMRKTCRKPFGKATRATHALELVHSDIYGPMNVKARHGASYFLTFIDDYTRYGYVYLISHRYEALDCFRRFVAEVENQQERSLKTF